MNRTNRLLTAVACAFALAGPLAASAHDMPEAAAASGAMEMSHGEIKAVDKSAGKLTIKHGELKNLGMPGMTMVFRVKDPAMLDQVKVGDNIDFMADKVNGALTVTILHAAH